MTREEAKKILEAYIACESKKAHFECNEFNCDDSCHLLYDMGTVGEYNEAINMAIQALDQEPCDDAKAIPPAEPKYCDRNICLRNEYNGIGCDECEATKSQEPKTEFWWNVIGGQREDL